MTTETECHTIEELDEYVKWVLEQRAKEEDNELRL